MAQEPSEDTRETDETSAGEGRSSPGERGLPEAEYKGLCVNCARREICEHPKPEGGVWHCDEYVEERYGS